MPNSDKVGKIIHVRPQNRLSQSLAIQARVVGALFLRETRTRFGNSILGYSWTLLEPAFQLAVWGAIFHLMGKLPPLSDSMMLFLITGLLPIMLFRDMVQQLTASITANRTLLQFPIVHNIDVVTARALLELANFFTLLTFSLATLGFFGVQFWPHDPTQLLLVVMAITLLGFGSGLINAVMACLFPTWAKFVPWYTRATYMTAGLFFLPGEMPPAARDFFFYLPMTQLVDWFRQAFFEGYQSQILSVPYILACGLGTTFVGLAMERVFRRKISVQT
ncbi:MAG: ABC transporter permease [Proteobacteria bacterium]|nr:ABC transporter permease [Pseudomonadota bacterium]